MEQLKSLPRYRKVLLWCLAGMLVIFALVYGYVSSRWGYEYQNAILLPKSQGDTTIYSGKVQGKPAIFTVDSGQGSVTFSYDGKTYGPYVAMEDPTAIPREYAGYEDFTGVELRLGDETVFRGYLFLGADGPVYFTEDGTGPAVTITYTSDGVEYDSDGNVVDPMEPGVYTLLELLYGLELSHKGQWGIFLLAVVISAVLAVSMVYAEDIFYLNLSFQLRNPADAEPSDWLLARWNIGWAVCCGLTLFVYIAGLL